MTSWSNSMGLDIYLQVICLEKQSSIKLQKVIKYKPVWIRANLFPVIFSFNLLRRKWKDIIILVCIFWMDFLEDNKILMFGIKSLLIQLLSEEFFILNVMKKSLWKDCLKELKPVVEKMTTKKLLKKEWKLSKTKLPQWSRPMEKQGSWLKSTQCNQLKKFQKMLEIHFLILVLLQNQELHLELNWFQLLEDQDLERELNVTNLRKSLVSSTSPQVIFWEKNKRMMDFMPISLQGILKMDSLFQVNFSFNSCAKPYISLEMVWLFWLMVSQEINKILINGTKLWVWIWLSRTWFTLNVQRKSWLKDCSREERQAEDPMIMKRQLRKD